MAIMEAALASPPRSLLRNRVASPQFWVGAPPPLLQAPSCHCPAGAKLYSKMSYRRFQKGHRIPPGRVCRDREGGETEGWGGDKGRLHCGWEGEKEARTGRGLRELSGEGKRKWQGKDSLMYLITLIFNFHSCFQMLYIDGRYFC